MFRFSRLLMIWGFIRARRAWVLAPILVFMLLLGLLLVVSQGSALAPFIYTLF